MATFKSDILNVTDLHAPVTASQAGVVVASVGSASVTMDLAINDIVQLCQLPKGHIPVDLQLETSDLDSATSITISVGVLNSDEDDLVASTNFITADDVAQAGGVIRANVVAGLGLTTSTDDRIIAAKIVAAAGTPVAGTIQCKLFYTENP